MRSTTKNLQMTDFDESGNSIRIILLNFAVNRTRNMEKDYRTADNLRQEKDMSVAEPQAEPARDPVCSRRLQRMHN